MELIATIYKIEYSGKRYYFSFWKVSGKFDYEVFRLKSGQLPDLRRVIGRGREDAHISVPRSMELIEWMVK